MTLSEIISNIIIVIAMPAKSEPDEPRLVMKPGYY